MVEARYEIKVTSGRKIIERHWENDYTAAQDKLDTVEDQYAGRYTVEFTDHQLFSGKFKGGK